MPAITGFPHLSLSVTDRSRSTRWYVDVLGFEIHAEIEGAGFQRTRLRHPHSGLTVTLTEHADGPRDRFDERRTGMDHVAFGVATMAEIEDAKRRFESLGVEHSEIKRREGSGAILTFRDPDGIQLELLTEEG